MSKSLGTVALAGSAATLLAPCFLSQGPAPSALPAREVSLRGAAQQGTSSSFVSQAAAATAATLSVAALATSRPRRVARPAFAGGLIGNESDPIVPGNFDPLGLAEKAPAALPYFREAELKHGRICMMAWVGLVVPEIVRIPGNDDCYNASVVDAHNACQGGIGSPLGQIFFFCGLIEMSTTYPKLVQGLTLENAGDYQFGASFMGTDPAKIKEMKLKELKNGRLAMIAFGGAITQAVITGNGFPWMSAIASSKGPGLTSSITAARGCAVGGKTAMRAGGYKMSKAVPFLPASPALEGYVGEEDGFDPLGVSLAIDIAWLREAELKHGRVCMLATVGWMATDLGFRVPGEPFANVSTLEAHDAMVKFGSMPQMLCWLGLLEVFGFLAFNNAAEGRTDRKPGDFGLRMFYPADEAGQYQMQLKELRNGRLAMLAYGGIVTTAVLTGKTWPFMDAVKEAAQAPAFGKGSAFCGGLQGSQKRGVATKAMERSASLPFMPKPANLAGYVGEETEFDPLGFSDTFDMKWLRESELKHGRVCMLACVGILATESGLTFPDFTPAPNSLDAVYTAPAGGMGLLLFIAGYIESSSYGGKMTMLDMFEDGKEPGYHFNFGGKFAGSTEDQIKTMRMKELSNGRLAMLAFSGMIHHNLVVKGPLFPLFPDNWEGPQGSWEFESVLGRLNTPGAASTWN